MFRRFNHKIFLVALFALSIIFAGTILAQDGQNILQQYKSIYSSNTPALENWGKSNLEVTAVGGFDALVNVEGMPDNLLSGKMVDENGRRIVWIPGGVIGTANNLIAQLHNQSASGVQYIAQVKDSLLGKPAYAQDTGVTGLQPLLPLWRGFRNVIYILSSIVFVVIGLMIMFRVKISPQAVITIQNAIPQLIITLIMVTFSYAVAGLIIDLSNLIQGIVVAIFFSIEGKSLSQPLFPMQVSTGFPLLSDLGNLIQRGYQELWGLLGGERPMEYAQLANPDFNMFNSLAFRAGPNWVSMLMLGGLIGDVIFGTFLGGMTRSVAGGIGADVGGTVGNVIGIIVGGGVGAILIPLIMAIIITIWMCKLWFGLLKAYVTVIFKIVLAPLEIGMGAFPSSKMGFSSWLTDLIANMAVFPIVNIYLILLNLIVNRIFSGGLLWAPNVINVGSGVVSPMIVSAAISFAGLSILAKLPELVPALIFQLKNPWGQAIGQALDGPASLNTMATFSKNASEVTRPISNWFKLRRQTTDPGLSTDVINDRLNFVTGNKSRPSNLDPGKPKVDRRPT